MKIPTSQVSGKGSFERPQIAEGLYEAELKEVKDISEGQYGKRVAFIYKLTLDNKEVEIGHVCYLPEVATPDNKFGRVLVAHGKELGKGDIDTDSLIGSSVRVMVEDYHYDEDGKDKIASSVTKVKPLVDIQKVE